MKLFVVYGQDAMYGGLHGMCTYEICEAETEEDAQSFARDLSFEVINDYSQIYDTLEEDWKETCDFEGIKDLESNEAEDILYEIICEDLDYGWYELNKDNLPTLDQEKLEEMLYCNPEEFIETYKRDPLL